MGLSRMSVSDYLSSPMSLEIISVIHKRLKQIVNVKVWLHKYKTDRRLRCTINTLQQVAVFID